MKKFLAFAVSFLTLCAFDARGQLYSLGNDPGSVKWMQARTANYRIVYPAGMDSLAREYAVSLEKFRGKAGASIGYLPNQCYRKPMPVILHPYVASSNGVVTWAPRRMELYTVPEDWRPLPMPSMEHLVIHESRHVAQMQFGADKPYRWLNVLSGEFWPGLMSAAYPGPTFLEGDAVVTETEMTESGRGRTSTFLGYYDICFSEGDFRDYAKWSFGSQKNYTPDHYRSGYLAIGGFRTVFDAPDFTQRYFSNINSNFLPFFNLKKTVKRVTGKKFNDAFMDICLWQRDEWEKNALRRGPFMLKEKITSPERLYTRFQEIAQAGEGFFSIRSGLDRTSELVRVYPDGHVKKVASIGSSAAGLTFSEPMGTLYWSEYRRDPRWELKSSSVIRRMDMYGKVSDLTCPGHKYYNPSADGDRIAVAEYPDEGGSAIVVLDAEGGAVLQRVTAPKGFQVVEFCWLDGRLFFSAVTDGGFGIYDSDFNEILHPARVTLSDLFTKDGEIFFTADRNGSQELYAVNPSDGSVRQFTSSRFGGESYCFRGDSLYFLSGSREDFGYYRTTVSDLPVRNVSFYDLEFPAMAEKLSAQAAEIMTAEPDTAIVSIDRYDKAAHLFHFHSWVPIWFNFDAVSSLSMDALTSDAGIGATAIFHNDLNTMQGYVGWSAWTLDSGWRNALHGKFSYSGWYPVIDFSFDLGDRQAIQYFPYRSEYFFRKDEGYSSKKLNVPSFRCATKVYVPLSFSSGGWSRGVIPQVEYAMTNDLFGTGDALRYIHTLSASVRAYTMKPIAPSCIYPRFGIGAEIGCIGHPLLESVTVSNRYAYLYGYVPGILRTHGIRMSALYENSSDNYLTTQFSYALPFAAVDWSALWPLMYLKNFEFTANCTMKHCITGTEKDSFVLRADIAAKFGKLLVIPYDTRIGISVNWNTTLRKAWVGAVFNVDL